MPKQLSEICQNIATMARVKVPTSFYGSTQRNARSIFLAVEQAVEDILRAQDWTQLRLRASYTITSLGLSRIALEENFDHINDNTIWSSTNNRKLIGPIDSAEMNSIRASGINPHTTAFQIRNKGPNDPSPYLNIWGTVENEAIIFDYQTLWHAYIEGSPAPVSTRYFTSDNQISCLDSDLIEIGGLAKFLRIIGRSYSDEVQDFNDMLTERIARDEGSMTVSLESEINQNTFIGLANTGYRVVP